MPLKISPSLLSRQVPNAFAIDANTSGALGGSILRGFSTQLVARWEFPSGMSRLTPPSMPSPSSVTSSPRPSPRLRGLRRPVRLDYSAPPSHAAGSSAPPSNRTVTPPGRILFVGNMPDGTEEADLRENFTPFDALESVRVATRPGGEPRGCVRELRGEADVYARPQLAGMRPCARPARTPRAIGGTFTTIGDEEALRTALNEFETSIQRVYVIRSNLADELTGSGFVEFLSVERAA
ncbi:hypothetical protein K438DRAFT_2028330 [Mycena galopus ATCC 62051]|nr:hypothetical protein K438DRAFT_2028330 [Mycena galopus ATCC 62051]